MKQTIEDEIKHLKSEEQINEFIKKYQPFIIKTISQLKKGYVSSSNDEFSLGLFAFHQAIKNFDPKRGNFLSFAKTVISNELKNYWQTEARQNHEFYDEEMISSNYEQENKLKLEILYLENQLQQFNICFDDLVDSPIVFKKTRQKVVHIAKESSKDKEVVQHLYQKRRLPISMIAKRQRASIKVIKTHKKFITSVIIICHEKYTEIIKFIF